jgi:phenylalanyl-tRNA synthetase beta chain
MKFSESWLREWVNPALATQALADQLTMAGLEVDAIDKVAGDFSGVVVARIVGVAQHPDADKLRVCQVSDGSETVQVVCGAPNAREGLTVAFARVGAVLPQTEIKKAKLRGVESFGMLCGADELGLAERSDGLIELPADAPLGADLRDYLQLDDRVIELGLTPNRADCLGIAGLAREVGVLNGLAVGGPVIEPVAAQLDETLPLRIEAEAACPRYVGRIVRGVDLSRPVPQWLTERLRRCGLRSINPAVDVTNYVMLELGQPMHAFDLAKLAGGIRVRLSAAGERLLSLDDQQLTLQAGELVIADDIGPVALAGIIGGKLSSVDEKTRDIFFESAYFAPEKLAGRARAYGLHTDSSHRFERGVDPQLQRRAMERATRLLIDICGGQPGPVQELAQSTLPAPSRIALRRAAIGQLLGVELPNERVEAILRGLGCTVDADAGGWQVVAPSWRFDIAIEADLLEELARIHGYDNLPVRSIRSATPLLAEREQALSLARVRRSLAARGYQEVITYSFVAPEMQALLEPGVATVELRNPISSDLAVMRTTLWAGLLTTAVHNLNRQQGRIRIFESGLRFLPGSTGLRQQPSLALLVTGRRFPESWCGGNDSVDFYDLKGDVEALLALARVDGEITFERADHSALHPGQSAAILRDGQPIGLIGALHPQLQQRLDLAQPLFLAELNLSALDGGRLPAFREISPYQSARRDLALLIDREVPSDAVLSAIREAAGENLRDLTLFDVYQGKGIDQQRKSLAVGLTFQHSSRTLADDEINEAVRSVIDILDHRFGAQLRN